jgi:hypothetical protein
VARSVRIRQNVSSLRPPAVFLRAYPRRKSCQGPPRRIGRILGRGAGEAPPFPTSSLLATEAIGVTTAPAPRRKVLKPGFSRNWVARCSLQSSALRKNECAAVIRADVMPHPHVPINCGKHVGKPSTACRPYDHSKRFQVRSCFRLPNVATMYIICTLSRQCQFAYSPNLQHLCLSIPFSGYRQRSRFRLACGVLAARGVRSLCNFARKPLL